MFTPRFWLFFCGISVATFMLANRPTTSNSTAHSRFVTDDTPLWDIMIRLGKIRMNTIDSNKLFDANKGYELVFQGVTTDFNGKRTSKLAANPCIACHTTDPEYPRLDVIDAQKRLLYADSLDLPFLPGAPFYGIINRIYFFTEDYQNKYTHPTLGNLMKQGHIDLRKAIQACNQIYAQGRELQDWEVESIIAYFWTLQIKMGNLEIDAADMTDINNALASNVGNAKAVNLLRRYYPEVYPATLAAPRSPTERRKTSPIINNFNNGRRVYKRSCLHCHSGKRYANFRLDEDQSTFQFLKKHFDDTTSRYSIYEALRYKPESRANRTGSPHYTSQRMSDQQLQDLRFYIIQMARFGNEAYDYYKNQR